MMMMMNFSEVAENLGCNQHFSLALFWLFLSGVIFSFANAVLVSLNLVGAAETTVEIIAVSTLKCKQTLSRTHSLNVIKPL